MFDGLLWAVVEEKPVWDRDGFLNWVVLERHRLTGTYRSTRIDEKWDATHAREFSNSGDGQVSGE